MKNIIKVSDTEIGVVEPVEIQQVVNQLEFNRRQQARMVAQGANLQAQIDQANKLGIVVPSHSLPNQPALGA